MLPNRNYIINLVQEKKWSCREFARRAGLSATEISRWMRGQRKGGKKLFSGLIKAFPNEPFEKLFFLDNYVTERKRFD